MAEINEKQIKTLRKLIETAETSLSGARELLSSLIGEEATLRPIGSTRPAAVITEGGRVVEGLFDGQRMVDDAGKAYPVPANYASKSKLVQGDLLKLIIAEDGGLTYKQIGPVERHKLIGTLHLRDGAYFVEARGQEFHVLFASVTYFKAQPGDQVSIVIPEGETADWAALEAVIG